MHAVPDEPEDAVPRLERFRAAHPEITITAPGRGRSAFWKAERGNEHLCHAYWLRQLLDKLETIT
jgi:hypothetical protein